MSQNQFLFAILQAICENATTITYHSNQVQINQRIITENDLQVFTEEDLKYRVSILLEQLDLHLISPVQLFQTWHTILSTTPSTSSKVLYQKAKALSFTSSAEDEQLTQWQQTFIKRLEETLGHYIQLIDTSKTTEIVTDLTNTLDLNPMLNGWAKQLLYGTQWAFIPATLPMLPPMPLKRYRSKARK